MKKRGFILIILLALSSIFLVYAQTFNSGKLILNNDNNEKIGFTGRLVSSDNLSVGDIFYLEDGRKARVTGVEDIVDTDSDFDNQNFFANGVLVHNKNDVKLTEYGNGADVINVKSEEGVRDLLGARNKDWTSRVDNPMAENPGMSIDELRKKGILSEEDTAKGIYGYNAKEHLEEDVAEFTRQSEEGKAFLFKTQTESGGINTQGIFESPLSAEVYNKMGSNPELFGLKPEVPFDVYEVGLNSNSIVKIRELRALCINPVEEFKALVKSTPPDVKVYVVTLAENKNYRNYFGVLGSKFDSEGKVLFPGVMQDITGAMKYPKTETISAVINGEIVSAEISNNLVLIDVRKLLDSCEYQKSIAVKGAKLFKAD